MVDPAFLDRKRAIIRQIEENDTNGNRYRARASQSLRFGNANAAQTETNAQAIQREVARIMREG
jgi:hypothetical protein